MLGYKKFLEQAAESALTPEAMRRLADLKLEKEYGFLGQEGGAVLPAPESTAVMPAGAKAAPGPARSATEVESDEGFERRAAGADGVVPSTERPDAPLPGGEQMEWAGPLDAIELYDRILERYPTYEFNDWVLYQKARAYDELGRSDEAIAVIERLVREYPRSRYTDEAQFRRAEYFFTRRKFLDAGPREI